MGELAMCIATLRELVLAILGGPACNADHPKLAKLLPVPSSMEAHHADIGTAVDTLEVNIPPLVTAEYWV